MLWCRDMEQDVITGNELITRYIQESGGWRVGDARENVTLRLDRNLPLLHLFSADRFNGHVSVECPMLLYYPIIQLAGDNMEDDRPQRIREHLESVVEDDLIFEEKDKRLEILIDRDVSLREMNQIKTCLPGKTYIECPVIKVQKDEHEQSSSGQSDV